MIGDSPDNRLSQYTLDDEQGLSTVPSAQLIGFDHKVDSEQPEKPLGFRQLAFIDERDALVRVVLKQQERRRFYFGTP